MFWAQGHGGGQDESLRDWGHHRRLRFYFIRVFQMSHENVRLVLDLVVRPLHGRV